MTKNAIVASVSAGYWALAHWFGYKLERAAIALAKFAGRAILAKLFKLQPTTKENTTMTTFATIPLGSVGKILVNEGGGTASVVVQAEVDLGGGQAAGLAKLKVNVEADISDRQAADLGFSLLEAKFESLKPFLEGARAEVDKILS